MKNKKFGVGRSITIIGLGLIGAILNRFTNFTNSLLFMIALAIIISGIFLEIKNQGK
jgi:hypothetical protein